MRVTGTGQTGEMDASYTLVTGPSPLDDSLRLRRDSGLTPKNAEQGAGAIAGSWSACHVVDEQGTVECRT